MESSGEALVDSLQGVTADVVVLLGRLVDPPRRPSTSQERRRLAGEAGRTANSLREICGELTRWMAGHDRGEQGLRPSDESTEPTAESREVSGDEALRDVTQAQAALDGARRKLQSSVETARSDGATWRQIGDALGITPQTAHKRFDPEARRRHAAYMRERYQRQRD